MRAVHAEARVGRGVVGRTGALSFADLPRTRGLPREEMTSTGVPESWLERGLGTELGKMPSLRPTDEQ